MKDRYRTIAAWTATASSSSYAYVNDWRARLGVRMFDCYMGCYAAMCL